MNSVPPEPINANWHRRVLEKLKRIMVDGSFIMDEVRYVYDWDNNQGLQANLSHVAQEDAALRYFQQIGVVVCRRERNEFRHQQFHGNEANKSLGVWGKLWDEADPARREYDQEVWVYGVDGDKYQRELAKFGLKDEGVTLSDISAIAPKSPLVGKYGLYVARRDGGVEYDGRQLKLKPQSGKLLRALIKSKTHSLSYDQLVNVLWDDDDASSTLLDNPNITTSKIKKRIADIVSETNRVALPVVGKSAIVSMGQTSYKLAD